MHLRSIIKKCFSTMVQLWDKMIHKSFILVYSWGLWFNNFLQLLCRFHIIVGNIIGFILSFKFNGLVLFKNNRNNEIKRPLKGLRAWKKITDNFALFTILLTLLRVVGGGGMGLAITKWPRASPDLKPPLVCVCMSVGVCVCECMCVCACVR